MNSHPLFKEYRRHRRLLAAIEENCKMHVRIELPTEIDKVRAQALLAVLSNSNWCWDGNPKQILEKFSVGEGIDNLTPHKFINAVSVSLHLKWDGDGYVGR